MQYEQQQPQPPEHINYSKEHPLKDFLWLLGAVALLIVTVLVVLHLCATLLAPYIPFKYEQKISQPFVDTLTSDEIDSESEYAEKKEEIRLYLQGLIDEISPLADLPEDMTITVHYSDNDTVNAFATLGGHIVIFRGLFERIDSENTLVMLLGHELAHVKHRDPIVSLGRGITSSIAIGLISGSTNNSSLTNYLGSTGLLTQLAFSRKQEENADDLAIKIMLERYGHLNGAEDLFEELQEYMHDEGHNEPFPFFSSHPKTQDRIEDIKNEKNVNRSNAVIDLPDFVVDYLSSDRESDEIPVKNSITDETSDRLEEMEEN